MAIPSRGSPLLHVLSEMSHLKSCVYSDTPVVGGRKTYLRAGRAWNLAIILLRQLWFSQIRRVAIGQFKVFSQQRIVLRPVYNNKFMEIMKLGLISENEIVFCLHTLNALFQTSRSGVHHILYGHSVCALTYVDLNF